jgi:hypothetical protein
MHQDYNCLYSNNMILNVFKVSIIFAVGAIDTESLIRQLFFDCRLDLNPCS